MKWSYIVLFTKHEPYACLTCAACLNAALVAVVVAGLGINSMLWLRSAAQAILKKEPLPSEAQLSKDRDAGGGH